MKKSKQSLKNKKGKKLSNEQLDKVSGGNCPPGSTFDPQWDECAVGKIGKKDDLKLK